MSEIIEKGIERVAQFEGMAIVMHPVGHVRALNPNLLRLDDLGLGWHVCLRARDPNHCAVAPPDALLYNGTVQAEAECIFEEAAEALREELRPVEIERRIMLGRIARAI